MAGEFQADAEDVLIPTSDAMVNEVANYRGYVDTLKSQVEEASTTSIIGDMGNALVDKVSEFHHAATNFLEELERTSTAVGTFGNMSVDQEAENSAAATAVDIDLS